MGFHLAFGVDWSQFESFSQSCVSLFGILLGQVQIEDILDKAFRESKGYLAVFLFFAYVAMVPLCLYFVYIAIVIHSHSRVQLSEPFADQIVTEFRYGLIYLRERLRQKLIELIDKKNWQRLKNRVHPKTAQEIAFTKEEEELRITVTF